MTVDKSQEEIELRALRDMIEQQKTDLEFLFEYNERRENCELSDADIAHFLELKARYAKPPP